jgi:hypothetical protein
VESAQQSPSRNKSSHIRLPKTKDAAKSVIEPVARRKGTRKTKLATMQSERRKKAAQKCGRLASRRTSTKPRKDS